MAEEGKKGREGRWQGRRRGEEVWVGKGEEGERGREVGEGAQWEVGEEGELSTKAVKVKLMVTVKSSPAAEKVCTLFIHHVNLLLCAVHLWREKAVQLVC